MPYRRSSRRRGGSSKRRRYGRRRSRRHSRKSGSFARKVRRIVRSTTGPRNALILTSLRQWTIYNFISLGTPGTGYWSNFADVSNFLEVTSLIAFAGGPGYNNRDETRQSSTIFIESVEIGGTLVGSDLVGTTDGTDIGAKFALFQVPYNGAEEAFPTVQLAGELGEAMYDLASSAAGNVARMDAYFHIPYNNLHKNDPIFLGDRRFYMSNGFRSFSNPNVAGVPATFGTATAFNMHFDGLGKTRTRNFRARWRVNRWFDYPTATSTVNITSRTPLVIATQGWLGTISANAAIAATTRNYIIIRWREKTAE